MVHNTQPLISGLDWCGILFVGLIPFCAVEGVVEVLGYSHRVALACGLEVMVIRLLMYLAMAALGRKRVSA